MAKTKKKVTKKIKASGQGRKGVHNALYATEHDFIIITGGALVVLMLVVVFFFL